MSSVFSEIEEFGFTIVREAVGEQLLKGFQDAVIELIGVDDADARYGLRGLLARSKQCRELAAQPTLRNLAQEVLGSSVLAVKGIFFDKNPEANWLVPWHQDLTITVRERHDVPGFGPWSVKDGLIHVQPPAHVMESILALRIHLDDTGADNGALRVLPGTHRRGRIPGAEIARLAKDITPVVCAAKRGDVLLMSPLLLHSSLPSDKPSHRRVIHVEYSALDLPGELAWQG